MLSFPFYSKWVREVINFLPLLNNKLLIINWAKWVHSFSPFLLYWVDSPHTECKRYSGCARELRGGVGFHSGITDSPNLPSYSFIHSPTVKVSIMYSPLQRRGKTDIAYHAQLSLRHNNNATSLLSHYTSVFCSSLPWWGGLYISVNYGRFYHPISFDPHSTSPVFVRIYNFPHHRLPNWHSLGWRVWTKVYCYMRSRLLYLTDSCLVHIHRVSSLWGRYLDTPWSFRPPPSSLWKQQEELSPVFAH